MLKQLDLERVDLTPEEGLVEEIEQDYGYKDNVYRALTMIATRCCVVTPVTGASPPTAAPQSLHTTGTTLHTRYHQTLPPSERVWPARLI